MSSRLARALLVLFASGAAIYASALSSGCSDEPAPAPIDASSEGGPRDASRPAPADDGAPPKSCREQCEEAHPSGLPKDEAINSCWETFCTDPCIEELETDGGAVADGAAPDGGTCESPVVTISRACDECTNTSCCASWDGCFQDPECVALNTCYQECAD